MSTDESTNEGTGVNWHVVIVTTVAAVAFVAVTYVVFWAAVSVTRADREKRSTVAEQCGTVENEALRTMCLEDAG